MKYNRKRYTYLKQGELNIEAYHITHKNKDTNNKKTQVNKMKEKEQMK